MHIDRDLPRRPGNSFTAHKGPDGSLAGKSPVPQSAGTEPDGAKRI